MPKKKEKTIVQQHKANFETLMRAMKDGSVMLMDCIEKETGEHVAVICAVSINPETEEADITPFAKFFNGNPYELLEPPVPTV